MIFVFLPGKRTKRFANRYVHRRSPEFARKPGRRISNVRPEGQRDGEAQEIQQKIEQLRKLAKKIAKQMEEIGFEGTY